MLFSRLSLYFHTIRHLRLRQIVYRIYYRFGKKFVHRKALAPLSDFCSRKWKSQWQAPSYMDQSFFEGGEVCFLGERGRISSASDWQNTSKPKLWLYNLHYFDDLNAIDAKTRATIHASMIERWIDENPPLSGVGWEPYPLSLRLVNWAKWLSGIGSSFLGPDLLSSYSRQAQALSAQVEHHILANHVFANGKALIFAGAFVSGNDADRWLNQGLHILDEQLKEQFLADGGHFERSPMYHSLLLWDICDLIYLAELTGLEELRKRVPQWKLVLQRGMVWMQAMTHPDGDIAFFNDATLGIAPSLEKLRQYAEQLGLNQISEKVSADRLFVMKDSGFIIIYLPGNGKAIIDAGNIGPSYQPGHAHAETLSFELSLFGQRVFVNSGIYCYGKGEERQRQRGTASHNTLVVDGQNSSEIWGGFRVARRARVEALDISSTAEKICISSSHNGYNRLPGKVLHQRKWEFASHRITITDTLSGIFSEAKVFFFLHPDIQAESISSNEIVLYLPTQQRINVIFSNTVDIQLLNSLWYPAFGIKIPNLKICLLFNSSVKAMKLTKTTIEW